LITIKTKDIQRSTYEQKLIIDATPQQINAVMNLLAKSKNGLQVDIKAFKRKRSLDANARCWATCREIADKLSSEGINMTDVDVYRKAILETNAYWLRPIKDERIEEHKEKFERIGVGWMAIPHIPCNLDGWTYVKEYYGSSIYNTKEMSDLINNLNQECEALDIPVMPAKEIQSLLDEWNKQQKGKDNK